MRRSDTVEEDLSCGPLKEKEIYYKSFTKEQEVHILVRVYKYRVFVGQFDTTATVWAITGESHHSIEVEVARYSIERALQVTDTGELLTQIETRFPGPDSIALFSAFCREKGLEFSIHEQGKI